MLALFIVFALFSQLSLAGVHRQLSLPSSSGTSDPPVYLTGSFTAADTLALNFTWAQDWDDTRGSYEVSFVGTTGSAHPGEICAATGIDSHIVTAGTPTTLAETITWSEAKSNCGGYMDTTRSGGSDSSVFMLQVIYVEKLYDFSANPPVDTGLTRTVANNYKFEVVTPFSFTIPSTGSVQLFGTTAMITSQNSTVSSTGQAAIMVSIFSDCSNTLTFPLSAFLTTASGPTVTSTNTTGTALASSKSAPAGAFANLCQWDVLVQITPSVADCDLTGTYDIFFVINYPDTSTHEFNSALSISSSDICNDVQYQVTAPDFMVNLYRRLADSSAGVPGSPPGGSINSGAGAANTVSKNDTAHGRLDIVPHVGTPVISSFSLTRLCWSSVSAAEAGGMTSGAQCLDAGQGLTNFATDLETTSGVMASITAGSLSNNILTATTYSGLLAVGQTVVGAGVPVGTTITGISGSDITLSNTATESFSGTYTTRAISNAVGGKSIVFFSFVWDPTFFTINASSVSRNIFVAITFSVTYVAPGSTRSMMTHRVHRAVIESSHMTRRSPSKYSAVASAVTLLSAVDTTTTTTPSSNSDSNTALIAALASIAGVLVLAAIAVPVFIVFRKRKNAKEAAAHNNLVEVSVQDL